MCMQMRLRLPFFVVFLLSIICLFFILHDTYRTFEVCSLLCSRARTSEASQNRRLHRLDRLASSLLWQWDCQHNCDPQQAANVQYTAMARPAKPAVTDSSQCTCDCWQWYSRRLACLRPSS